MEKFKDINFGSVSLPERKPIAFEAFQNHLSRITGLKPECFTMETNLLVDLSLDSLKLLEIVLEFEKLGVPVSMADAWSIQTVGDAWEYYQRFAAVPDIGNG
jgi:acyl carrier protein